MHHARSGAKLSNERDANNLMNILLTGGRAPATLELARAFHRSGHTVFMAESLRGHLSQPSRSIYKNFFIPPPRQQTGKFIQALRNIIDENKVDLLIPTCEEIFYTAMYREQLPCRVFVEPIEKLNALHNKWTFILKASEYGLSVPETILIGGQDDLMRAFNKWQRLVIKPAYSRFAARTLILPTFSEALASLPMDLNQPMIAQQYIQGQGFCTYSICHHGQLTAHTTYPSNFTAGKTGTILIYHVEHAGILSWVRKIVNAMKFTGQIAFDFVETSNGEIFAIECNPHANGISAVLLASNSDLTSAFLDPSTPCINPKSNTSAMLSAGMLIYALPTALRNRGFLKWLKAFFSSRDFVFRWDDPMPALLQGRSLLHYFKFAHKNKLSLLDASMFDIEWNGFSTSSQESL